MSTDIARGVEWRATDFPGYEVSSFGDVRSSSRLVATHHNGQRPVKGRILSPNVTAKGYRRVQLSHLGKRRHYMVHRLVCTAFHGAPPTEAHQAAHVDGNPANNCAENLRWATASENALDKVRHGTHTMANKTRCPQGHEYSEENTYAHKRTRRCRACRRGRNKRVEACT